MPKWLSALLTTIAGSGHVINAASGLIPHEYQLPVGVGLVLAQNYITNLAHAYNPDGTKAEVAYVRRADQSIVYTPVNPIDPMDKDKK